MMAKTFKTQILASVSATVLCTALIAGSAQAQNKKNVTTTSPTLNFYGLPGLIDMPSAEAMPSGQGAIGISHFAGQTRTSFSFQFSPRISATFRYIGIQDFNDLGFDTYRDRSFDFRYLIAKEGRIRPAITVGLQDFSGTGIYAGEYLVATKNFDRPLSLPGKFKVTAGLGWGRLGTLGSIGSPFGADRPVFTGGDTGGELSIDQWFRGPMAPFGGIEWQVNDRLGLKAEYSTDAYTPETSRGVFTQESRLNFGAEYQVNRGLRLGAYYLYGSEFGINAQLQFNPNRPVSPFALAGPRPVIVRPDRAVNPDAYDTTWADSERAPGVIRDAIAPELAEDGIQLEAVTISSIRAELRVSTGRFENQAIVVGRVARTMARILPPSVETFDIVLVNNGLAMSKVTVARTDIETLEFVPRASGALLPVTVIDSAEANPPANALIEEDLYPSLSWSIGPYVRTSFFDPDKPVRVDVGVSAIASYRFAPGWQLAGEVRHRLAGNIADSDRLSNSVLPRVRTNAVLYARGGDTTIENLYLAKQWKPSKNTYARVSMGYFEQMFGGVSSEVLWKPASSRLALGIEANYVMQRDFDQLFGFQDYDVATGHVSAYYNFGGGYYAQVDVGRYLAGDHGATFTLERQFANGWRVGGFFTMTNVSSEDFGEGSFDKGITLTIPTSWFTGRPSKQVVQQTIRPIQRDGGARLSVPGRLYEQVRGGHKSDLVADWGRVWE
ncbi:YjbH domain-containing protein [uncultured Tateyamaria sp.]|uniref:YjbH domain-containing protein n=1 Tax=uncultured Tateyamaria sp. TaxID=455651 RepID=UPI0026036AA3|nr:YjbH domain-containing protein [uncultured Tateyamaria sp.]